MKKKILMFSLITTGIIAIVSFALSSANLGSMHGIKAEKESYGITFDSTKNKFHDHSGAAPYSGKTIVKTNRGSDITFTYYQTMGWRNTWHVFGSGGYFYNTDPIHGMEFISLCFNSSGVSYSIYYSGDSSFDKFKSFTSVAGSIVSFDFDGYKPNYFKLVNTDGNANLNIMSACISLSCSNIHPTVVLSSQSEEMGVVTGSGEKNIGDHVTITAAPNKGYRFVGWYDGETLVSTDASYSFVVGNSDIAYSARFAYESYNLVATSEGEAKGTVSGIGSYNYLDNVSIEATANEGYTFIGWYDGEKLVSANNPYEFTMPYNDINYVARYSANKYSLSLTNENEDLGSISGAGTFEYGSSVTITANPNKGVSFIGWYGPDGELISSDPIYSFSMPHEDLSYSAWFAWTQYTVSVSVNDDSMGSVTGSGSYTYGQEVTLVATTNEHHSFYGWYDGDNLLSQDSSYSFAMPDKSLDYTARFVKNYKINVFSDNESMGTVSAPEEWGEGLKVTVRADAKQGYVIDYWCDTNMIKVSQDFNYSFLMPSADIELYAIFTTGYSFLVTSSNPATGTVNDASGQYKAGTTIIIEATCKSAYFKGWYDESGELISKLNPYSFSMPSNDYAITALFHTSEELADGYATVPTLSANGRTIDYGLYPQMVVDDSSLTSFLDSLAKQEANGWYFYDGDYYVKATAKPYDSSRKFSNGTTIEKGKGYWFRCEPIEWKILDDDNGKYFVVSEYILDSGCYYNSISDRTIYGKMVYANNYECSDIRSWLNDDFYGSAFALGNGSILTTSVDNSVSSTGYSSNKYACKYNTNDKMFLLSRMETLKGFSSYRTRAAYSTDYAKCQGVGFNPSDGVSSWWLRSPYYDNSMFVMYVDGGGDLSYGSVTCASGGVRHAMRINLS